jgi:hypothetical protein
MRRVTIDESYNNLKKIEHVTISGLKACDASESTKDGVLVHGLLKFLRDVDGNHNDQPRATFAAIVVGINNIRDDPHRRTPDEHADQLLKFMRDVQRELAEATLLWASIGCARSDQQPCYDMLARVRKVLVERQNAKSSWPERLVYEDLSYDCKDTCIRDESCHWTNDYAAVVMRRIGEKIKEHEGESQMIAQRNNQQRKKTSVPDPTNLYCISET